MLCYSSFMDERGVPEAFCERCGGASEPVSFMIISGRRDDGERLAEALFIYQCLAGCLAIDPVTGEEVPLQFPVANADLTRRYCMTDEEREIGAVIDEQLS